MERLVARLRADGVLADPALESALKAIDRSMFLPKSLAAAAYEDDAVVTRLDPSGAPVSSCSQPSTVVFMLERLGVEPGMRILEIGTGTGWNAALLSSLSGPAGQVCSLELESETAQEATRNLRRAGFETVVVRTGEGSIGLRELGPYDRIIATAGAPEIFPAWLEQLKPGGRIIVPYQIEGLNTPLLRLDLGPDGAVGRFCGDTEFMPMRGGSQRRAATVQGRPALRELLATTPTVLPAFWTTDASGDWPSRRSLLFFLHLRDPRVLAVYMGGDNWRSWVGLWDGAEDLALVADGRIVSFGAGRCRADLAALHEEWTRLGRPAPEDYEVKVSSRACGARSWILGRGTPLACSLP